MSAELIEEERNKLPIWVVHGVNFHVEVQLDAYNAGFDTETQSWEAVSKAIMAFKGNDNGFYVVMDTDEDTPLLNTVVIVHLKGTLPEKGFAHPTYEALANDGFYKDSVHMQELFLKELEEAKLTEALEAKRLKKK